MQKKLIALAVASLVSGPVFAAGSSVTVYGTFDAGVRHVDTVNAAGDSNTTMDSAGTYNSNRWGFKGSEDLGNGLSATFKLEGGFLSGSGTGSISGGLFGRGQIVGLHSKNWGKLDLGRNYTSIFYTTGGYDPFHYKYTGIIPIAGLDGARRDNTITYTSNPMNGLVFRANYALGEVAGSSSTGSNTELGISYGNGPFSMGAAYGTDKVTSSTTSKQWTIGGAYKAGPWEFMVGYDTDKTDVATGGDLERTVSWLGGKYKLDGANALSAAYYHDDLDSPTAGADGTKKTFIVSFVHNLSKRTEFYVDMDHAALEGSKKMGSQDSVLGFSVGINHAW